ncbi:MAG: hypothetical protein ABSB91_09725 [Sedimentisphaerales bacterium]|jgi:hypothetical protein
MSESENKKSSVSKLAVFSFLSVLLGLVTIAALVLLEVKNIELPEIILRILVAIMAGFIFSGFAFGVIALIKITKSKGTLRGILFSVSAIIVSAGLIIVMFWPTPNIERNRGICLYHLGQLDIALHAYADEHNNTYPDPNQWCDLTFNYIEDQDLKLFICPGALKRGDKAMCHYAMNPNCEPSSPNDVVLLFEAKGGWNQHGGPELLTFDNHKKKGAAIGFNDNHVEIVRPEDVNKLKWKAEDGNNIK